MNILLQLFEIISLKRRPSDISFDQTAAVIAFLAAIATTYFQLIANQTFTQAPLQFVITQALAQAVIFWLLLKSRGKDIRFVQTATALFGTAAILQFAALFIILVPALTILGIFLTAWSFYLMVLILSEAIDCNIIQSVLITIAYHFVIGLILVFLFPELFEQMRAAIEANAKA